MGRIILGIIAGFVVWSIVWVGGDQTLAALSPTWLGAYSDTAEKAIFNRGAFTPDITIVCIYLVRSFLTSIIAGYMAALVAGEYKKSTLILGIVLVLAGVAFEYRSWDIAPAWYHILFILFLIPMTILGGRLRRPS